jgi:hypothetical protein
VLQVHDLLLQDQLKLIQPLLSLSRQPRTPLPKRILLLVVQLVNVLVVLWPTLNKCPYPYVFDSSGFPLNTFLPNFTRKAILVLL